MVLEMKNQLVNELIDIAIEELSEPEVQTVVKECVIDPLLGYIIDKLKPFIIASVVTVIILFVLLVVLIYVILTSDFS